MVRSELMRVLSYLVTKIQEDLERCEPGSAEPSTMETRLLRLVRTLSEAREETPSLEMEDEGRKAGDFSGFQGFQARFEAKVDRNELARGL